jgi:hypothetical protein
MAFRRRKGYLLGVDRSAVEMAEFRNPWQPRRTNRDEFIDTLGDANVVLILTGHYHKAQVDRYRSRNFVQLPSPGPNGEREFMVIRFLNGRIFALPYNYRTRQCVTEPRKMLDPGHAFLGRHRRFDAAGGDFARA